MRALLVVFDQISIQIFLHLVNGFIPRFSSDDAEVFIEDGSVQPLDEAVGLGTVDLVCGCGARSLLAVGTVRRDADLGDRRILDRCRRGSPVWQPGVCQRWARRGY